MSIKTTPSDTPHSDREALTEIVSFGSGPLGTGTLAFEPGFSLDTQYSGEAPAFDEGSKFGVYVVGPCIGEGGMARVYRAEHAGLKRQVALKVMTQGFARDSEGRERFLREARIAAAIKHPNVVNIFDVGVCQGIPYLVMELLEGEDLEKVLLSKGALDEGTIIDLVVPVVAGLVAVHDAGIVHRDLKPGNIFLARGRNEEIEPKLLDFGISKASGKDHLKLTAANGSLMGTPFYMAPEAVQGSEMTPLSDQYALGVVLRECATGKNPFEGNNFAEVVGLIASAKYGSLAEMNPRLSKRFVAIVERAMSVDPKNRFDDMRAMGRQLLLLAGQRTRITWGLTFGPEGRGPVSLATLDRHVPDSSTDLPQLRPNRKKRTTWLLLAGVAVFSAGVTSLFLGSPRDGGGEGEATARYTAPSSDVTLVMPNAPTQNRPLPGSASDQVVRSTAPSEPAAPPIGDSQVAAAAEPAAPPEPAAPAPSSKASAARDNAARDTDAQQTDRGTPRKVAAALGRDRKAKVAAPRRRVAPRPAPQTTETEEADWDIKVSSKAANTSKPSFEVGSNNAPILD